MTPDLVTSIKAQDDSTDETFGLDSQEHSPERGRMDRYRGIAAAPGCRFHRYRGLTVDNVDVPISGYVPTAFGVIFSLIVGVGLIGADLLQQRQGQPPV